MTMTFMDNPTPPDPKWAFRDLNESTIYPYDAPDGWDFDNPLDNDVELTAARAIIHNLMDRRDIKRGFEHVDEDVRREIVETIALIIKVAPRWYDDQMGVTYFDYPTVIAALRQQLRDAGIEPAL